MKHKTKISLLLCCILTCIIFLNSCSNDKYQSTAPTTSVSHQEITINFSFGERTGTYSGKLLNGLPNGYGTFTSTNEAGTSWSYEGNWLNGHFQGQGTTTWSNGNKHTGEYSNDYMHGIGTYYENDTVLYQGVFSNGEFIDNESAAETEITNDTLSEAQTNKSTSISSDSIDNSTVIKSLEIKEYSWSNRYNNYVAFEITSTSDFVGALDIHLILYDSDNNPIGSKKKRCEIIEKGIPVLITLTNEEEYDHYDYKLTPDESYYKPVVSKLNSSVNETNQKLVISVTNNSDTVARFVECTALFFKDGKPIGYDFCYCIDSDDSLKPNDTQIGEITKLPDSDSYLLFIDSRSE